MGSLRNLFTLIRDFFIFGILVVNVLWQSTVGSAMFLRWSAIVYQCKPVRIYSFGILSTTAGMLLTIVSSVISFAVYGKQHDIFLSVITLFNIGWLAFAGVGSIMNLLTCKTPDYPFFESLIILGVDAAIGLALMAVGNRCAHSRRKVEIDLENETKRIESEQRKTFLRRKYPSTGLKKNVSFLVENNVTFPQNALNRQNNSESSQNSISEFIQAYATYE